MTNLSSLFGTTRRQEWAVISSNSAAQSNNGYLINASNNSVTLTLPSNPSLGDFVSFCDFYNMATTNIISIAGNGKNIEGSSENLIVNIDGAAGTLVYTDETRGWILSSNAGNSVQTTFDYQQYVDRGDAPDWDFETVDFTTDASWYDLDLSSIIPSNAIAVFIRVQIEDDATESFIRFRKNGNSTIYSCPIIRTQVANILNESLLFVSCDSSQIIEYQTTNTTFTSIKAVIMGWFTDDDQTAVGSGNVYAPSDLADNYLIRGDGGGKNAQTSTVNVTDNGEMTNTGQPCFSVSPTQAQPNIAVNTQVTIVLDTERFDVGNNFDTGTYTFTAPVTGKYQLNLIVRLGQIDSGATYYYVAIVTSNSQYINIFDPSKFSGDVAYMSFNVSVLADMDANDTAFARVYQADGNQQTDVQTNTHFSGVLIC